MIFGLEETDKENLQDRTMEVFEKLDEKPLFKAERVGRRLTTTKVDQLR